MSRNTKSLRSYADKYQPNYVFRFSPRNFIKSEAFINLPLYSIFALKPILEELVTSKK
jgi:hypothetical protein